MPSVRIQLTTNLSHVHFPLFFHWIRSGAGGCVKWYYLLSRGKYREKHPSFCSSYSLFLAFLVFSTRKIDTVLFYLSGFDRYYTKENSLTAFTSFSLYFSYWPYPKFRLMKSSCVLNSLGFTSLSKKVSSITSYKLL